MQTYHPWGTEVPGFKLEVPLLNQLKNISNLCDTYYLEVEKKRNGSIEEWHPPLELKDEIMGQLEQLCEQLKNQEPYYALVLDQSLMKQSLMASIIAHSLGFDYCVQNVVFLNGKWDVRGILRDRQGRTVEASGTAECLNPGDAVASTGSFYMASKKAFISSVSSLSELDVVSRFSEVLI